MGKKVNPIIIRIPKYKSWPFLWHSDRTYTPLIMQDLFIRKYVKDIFRQYKIIVSSCVIKRSLRAVFIQVRLFNLNYNINYQFKPFMFLRSYKMIRSIINVEIARMTYSISRIFNTGPVCFCFKSIRWQKPNFRTVAITADPIILSTYFIRKYTHMYAFKHIFKTFKGLYRSLARKEFNLKGLRVQVSGPVGAPRNRMAKRITKNFFGTTPLQTFCSLIAYSVKSRSLSEGVITAKFWLYKKFPHAWLLEGHNLFKVVKNMLRARRRLVRMNLPRARRKALKQGKRRRFWAVKFIRFTKMFKFKRHISSVPYVFFYNVFRGRLDAYLRSHDLFAAVQQLFEHRKRLGRRFRGYVDLEKFVHAYNQEHPYHFVRKANQKRKKINFKKR